MSSPVQGHGAAATAEAVAADPPEKAPPSKGRKRRQLPRIDLDKTIEDAKEAIKKASKAMAEARVQARNERRKKARLLKKAATLSPQDLERIAVLKRCGLWEPSMGVPALDGSALEIASAASASGATSACSSSSKTSQSKALTPAETACDAAEPAAAAPVAEVAVDDGNSEAEKRSEAGDRAASEEEGTGL